MKRDSIQPVCAAIIAVSLLLLASGCATSPGPRFPTTEEGERLVEQGAQAEAEGNYEQAIEYYREATREMRHPEVYFFLGNAYYHEGEVDQAVKAYEEAVNMDSNFADALNNLAWLYYEEDMRLQRARELAVRATLLNPNNESYADTLLHIRKALGEDIEEDR